MATMDLTSFSKQPIKELKKILKENNLSVLGSKVDLSMRIFYFYFWNLHRNTQISIYCYDDKHGWGRDFLKILTEHHFSCYLFSNAKDVPDSISTFVYMHPDHLHNRELDREIINFFQKFRFSQFIPSLMELLVYDEKISQSQLFSKWLPKTWYLKSEDSAKSMLRNIKLPIISKSNEGAASSNVRLLMSNSDAKKEINMIFNGNGIPRYSKHHETGLFQEKYLLWQEFLHGNTNDWRVIMLGQKYAWILKRYNREDMPFASGSNKSSPILNLDSEIIEILNYTFDFVYENNLNFTGIDLIRDSSMELKILETTTGWGTKSYSSRVFERLEDGEWRPTIFKGRDQWKIASLAVAGMIEKSIL